MSNMIYSFFNQLKFIIVCLHAFIELLTSACVFAGKKHIHEVAGLKSYVKAGYSNFPELPRAAQILWESFASN